LVSIYEPRDSAPAGRIPPHNIEAEESLLGAMMLSREALSAAAEARVEPRDFYKPTHGHIYDACDHLHRNGEPVDPVTVAEELRRRGLLDAVGGRAELVRIQAATPASANAMHYAQIVGELALLRRLIAVAGDIAEMGYSAPNGVDETLDRAEQLIFDIAEKRVSDSLISLYPALEATMDQLEHLYNRETTVVGVPTGYLDLDDLLLGLQPSQLVVVAARPGQGKCIAHDALVVDPLSGARRSAAELHGRARAGAPVHVLALDTEGGDQLVPVAPSAFVDDGVRRVWRVRTALGREITATACHPFLTPAGWRRLEDLRPGSVVAVPAYLPVEGTTPVEEPVAALLGHVSAYGAGRGEPFSVETVEAAADLARNADVLGLALYELDAGCFRLTGKGGRARRLCALLESYGAAQDDDVPAAVERWPHDGVAAFLRRYLARGAGVGIDRGRPRVVLRAHAALAARSVAHLLLRLGVVVRRDAERLEVADDESLVRFIERVGLVGRDRALHALAARCGVPAVVGAASAAAAPAGPPGCGARRAIWWDDVVGVDDAGETRVFDLTVPAHHTFVADDVIVHNTSFALGAAAHVALQSRKPVVFFSMEMGHLELTKRLLSSEARVDARSLSTGRLSEAEWPKVTQAVGRLAEAPFFIDDNPHCTVMEMRAKARRIKAQHGDLGLIVVDYLQLMSSSKPAESRQVEVSELSRGLKILARELEVPVMTLSQLNRQLEYRQDKRPMLADLRESGCLPASAQIARAGGDTVAIGELYRRDATDVEVLTLDERFRLVPGRISNVFRTGIKTVFEMRLASGRTIRATANHPFFTLEGWVQLGDLRPGDRIAVAPTGRERSGTIPSTVWDYLERKGMLAAGLRAHDLIHRIAGPGGTAATYRDGVSRSLMLRIAGEVDDVFLHDLARSEVDWDRVVRIRRCAEEEVFDATVPGTHNFVADGVVVHNSIEQDADVVLFIYRDEYYHPESDQRGTAEVIVAKHRNGPTGMTRLAFLDHFTKFANMARE
jgi:replicative DNA helicase